MSLISDRVSMQSVNTLEVESSGLLCLPLFPMNHPPTARMKPTGQDIGASKSFLSVHTQY